MSHKPFSIEERESILEYLVLGSKNSEIALNLGRCRLSIGRELSRNSI